MKTLLINTDGGARGNPGPAGAAFIIFDSSSKPITKSAKFLGITTNNVAEYQAVIEALSWLTKNSLINQTDKLEIKFYLDSMLVVNQLNGLYKIKDIKLKKLAIKIRILENLVGGNISYYFIPREKNKIADSLVNKIIDKSNLQTSKKDRNNVLF